MNTVNHVFTLKKVQSKRSHNEPDLVNFFEKNRRIKKGSLDLLYPTHYSNMPTGSRKDTKLSERDLQMINELVDVVSTSTNSSAIKIKNAYPVSPINVTTQNVVEQTVPRLEKRPQICKIDFEDQSYKKIMLDDQTEKILENKADGKKSKKRSKKKGLSSNKLSQNDSNRSTNKTRRRKMTISQRPIPVTVYLRVKNTLHLIFADGLRAKILMHTTSPDFLTFTTKLLAA